jgi:hypothetical protein
MPNNPRLNWTVAGIIAVIIIGFLLMRNQSANPTVANDNNFSNPVINNPNDIGLMVEDNSIYVSGMGEDDELTATTAVFKDGGYVVVHADNNGQPGAIIGNSSYLDAGTHNNVSVKLSRVVKENDTLHVMLHGDDGDKNFSASKDTDIKGGSGQPIAMVIKVTRENSSDDNINSPTLQ